MAKTVADRAIQVLGGYVGEYTVERLWRDAKLLKIGGGTKELQQTRCQEIFLEWFRIWNNQFGL